ncbi:MAG: hypothetical protein KDK07_02435 [Bauldia sp.]|nr:hypothetical protein [Verrucomicrobiae bacterium]MCB1498640.1 hypothetical protein [Bauldia sp.]
MMERSEILAARGELKLYGMKTAFDEIITTAVKRQHETPPTSPSANGRVSSATPR